MVSEEEEKSGDDGGDSCRRSVEGVKRSRGGKADLSFVNVFTCRTTFFFSFLSSVRPQKYYAVIREVNQQIPQKRGLLQFYLGSVD